MGSDQVAEMLHFASAASSACDYPRRRSSAGDREPKQLTEIARIALRRFIELDAAPVALVVVLDDMQWATATPSACQRDRRGLGGSPVVLLTRRGPTCSSTPRAGAGARSTTSASTCATRADDAEQMFRNLLSASRTYPTTSRRPRSR